MAEHGAFMLSSAQAGPDDPDFRARVLELTARTAKRLGRQIRLHAGRSGGTDAALGLVAMSALERSWFYVYGMQLSVDADEIIEAVSETMYGLLEPGHAPRPGGRVST
jgi:hypothetical protein